MSEIISHVVMGLTAIIVIAALVALIHIINGAEELEWVHLVSTRTVDGYQRADWNKIGQGLGVVLSVWLPAVYVYSPKMEATGLAAVLGVVLLYLGGVSSYAATLRARQGTVETRTEPVPDDPAPVIRTVTQNPPIAKETRKGR